MTQDEKYRRLNHEFYTNAPSTYFRDRLQMLVLRGANPSLIDDNIGEETVWGQLRAIVTPNRSDESPEVAEAKKRAAHDRFLVTESQVLLHHVAEALLRMYLAHESQAECPWLAIAAFKDHRMFREKLDELAQPTWTEDRMNAAGWVFLGGVPEQPSSAWIEQRDAAVRLLRILAGTVNRDSQLYNAAKHGATALGSVTSMHFLPAEPGEPAPEFTGKPLEGEIRFADGVSVSFLEREGTRKNGTWYHKTQWILPERAAYLTQLAILQMEAMWTIARCRYLGEALPKGVEVITGQALDLLREFIRNGPGESWRWFVATETIGKPDRPGSA